MKVRVSGTVGSRKVGRKERERAQIGGGRVFLSSCALSQRGHWVRLFLDCLSKQRGYQSAYSLWNADARKHTLAHSRQNLFISALIKNNYLTAASNPAFLIPASQHHHHPSALSPVTGMHRQVNNCSVKEWTLTQNAVLPDKGGKCASQCQDPQRRGCPDRPSRHTTASSSPCSTHTAEARERDGQPHGRDTCTECEENKKRGRGGRGCAQCEQGRDRVRGGESVWNRGSSKGWEKERGRGRRVREKPEVVEFKGQSCRVGVFSTEHHYSFLVAASSYTTSKQKKAKISPSLFIPHYHSIYRCCLHLLLEARAGCFQGEAWSV